LSNVTWTCTPTPPASCPHASGANTINETISLASGQTLTYALTGTVIGPVNTALANTVSVTPPGAVPDPDLTNNKATDSDTIIDDIFKDNFGGN